MPLLGERKRYSSYNLSTYLFGSFCTKTHSEGQRTAGSDIAPHDKDCSPISIYKGKDNCSLALLPSNHTADDLEDSLVNRHTPGAKRILRKFSTVSVLFYWNKYMLAYPGWNITSHLNSLLKLLSPFALPVLCQTGMNVSRSNQLQVCCVL